MDLFYATTTKIKFSWKLCNNFFPNKRDLIDQILSEKFCGGLESLLVSSECGSNTCALQSENHLNVPTPGNNITISFTIVIRSQRSTLPTIEAKIQEINLSLNGFMEKGLTFGKGTTTTTRGKCTL